jgi:hypothetical protein
MTNRLMFFSIVTVVLAAKAGSYKIAYVRIKVIELKR